MHYDSLLECIYKANCDCCGKGLDKKGSKIRSTILHTLLVKNEHHKGGHHCEAHQSLLLVTHMLELPKKGVQVKIRFLEVDEEDCYEKWRQAVDDIEKCCCSGTREQDD